MSDEEKRKIRQACDLAKRAPQHIEIPGVRHNYFSTEEQLRQDRQARRGRRIAFGVLVFAATLGLGGWRFFSAGACHASGAGYINSAGVWVRSPTCADHNLPDATALCNDGSQSFSRHSWSACN
jgi:hypothetical protein